MKRKIGSWHDCLELLPVGSLNSNADKKELDKILAGVEINPFLFERPSPEETYKNQKPVFYSSNIQAYELFKNNIYSPKRVLYPSCDMDASPIQAFSDAQVDLVDINEYAVAALNRNGVRAFNSDIRNFNASEPYDLVVLLNSCIPSDYIFPFLDDKGFVMANNWSNNASQLIKDKRFESIGTIVSKPIKTDNGNWNYGHVLELGKIVGIDVVSDYFWIFRKK